MCKLTGLAYSSKLTTRKTLLVLIDRIPSPGAGSSFPDIS